MPVQHSPPAKNTRSQRNQAILTPTARAPLDHKWSVHQLSANLDRGPPIEGAAPSRRGGPRIRLGEAEDEEERSLWKRKGLRRPPQVFMRLVRLQIYPFLINLLSQADPNFLKMTEKMTQFMLQLTQAVAPRDISRAPALKTTLMKAPDSFDGTQAHKFRGFIQSCQLIFHNDPAKFFPDRKKVLY
ncbi:hypothetical protein O181_031813 [Austropuccinia psidii MF-1]|uniref:Uncharacterized protein n=1 Tax=Austropuccinia psidii MF-1 TaxID=1389203 RepID=A0A9Q3H4Z5_9BASI|nr:hypothetical protein [Austropuccinia psidii MF-1]